MYRQGVGWTRIWAVSKSTGTSGNAKEDAKRKTPKSVEMKGYGGKKTWLGMFSNMATASSPGCFTPRHLLNKKMGRP
jgi:hypothetical protein